MMNYLPEFKDYKDAIVDSFLNLKQESPDWSSRITRAGIRKRFLQYAQIDMEKADRETIRRWLKAAIADDDLYHALKRKSADDFKAFEIFLNDPAMNPAEDNVEMIAVLTRYPHRPFSVFNKKPGLHDEPQKPSGPSENDPVKESEQPSGLSEPKATLSETIPGRVSQTKWWYTIVAIGVAGLCMILYLNRQRCMYWSNDRYVPAACSPPKLDTPLVAIDEAKLSGFKQILRTDTLTGYAREHYWYTRIGNHYEVFTGRGTHPQFPDKALKRVTDFVINYCHNHPDEDN